MKYPVAEEVIDMHGEPDDVAPAYGSKARPPVVLFKAIVPGYTRKGPNGLVVVRSYSTKVQARAKPATADHKTAQLFAASAAQAAQTAPGAERPRSPEHTGHRSLMDEEMDAINFASRRYHLMSKQRFLSHLREHNAKFEESRAKSPRGRAAARQRAVDQFNQEDAAGIHLRSVIAADQQGLRVSQLAQADYPHLFASAGQNIEVRGMRITVEHPRGSTRSKTPRSGGPAWQQVMVHHYGEFPGTKGADGDPVDVFVGPDHTASSVYIVNQHKQTGEFDEHKVMVGFPNGRAALAGYLAHYPAGWNGARSVASMPVAAFKKWLASSDKSRPVTENNVGHA